MMILILFVDIPEAGAEALMLLCGGIILLSLVMYGRFYHAILDQAPSGSQQQKTLRTARNVVLGLIWVGIIVICFIHRKELSAEEIARYTPGNPWLAGIVLLALFALKSLSIVIYSGVLYAANGILFPPSGGNPFESDWYSNHGDLAIPDWEKNWGFRIRQTDKWMWTAICTV